MTAASLLERCRWWKFKQQLMLRRSSTVVLLLMLVLLVARPQLAASRVSVACVDTLANSCVITPAGDIDCTGLTDWGEALPSGPFTQVRNRQPRQCRSPCKHSPARHRCMRAVVVLVVSLLFSGIMQVVCGGSSSAYACALDWTGTVACSAGVSPSISTAVQVSARGSHATLKPTAWIA